ncbi:DUF4215 domain-containing protein [Sandaracinus amylolyticus]|uniref:DUF4215 domain-containing protein n=1 Tax=Sandaracinus amylolyticus TaxID=927083 RepID=UPI0009F9E232|nr:DUF4215 domain-containing protein [Sandaracinus amylolyticus]
MQRLSRLVLIVGSLSLFACTEREPRDATDAGGGGSPDANTALDGGPVDARIDDACGNGRFVEGLEQCDDGNLTPGDGCNATCMLEDGWRCPGAGLPCVARECGDGIVAGVGALGEECDDDNAAPGDGCSETCKVEDGWVCEASGCRRTECGDGTAEGSEDCDDGNEFPFDGCSECVVVPQCAVGACASVCGDGMKFPDEPCDDGNVAAGDGCSPTCAIEEGWGCTAEPDEFPPVSLEVPTVFRDFVMVPTAAGTAHRDFNHTVGSQGVSPGMVEAMLDANGDPVYTGICEIGATAGTCRGDAAGNWQTHSELEWNQWYRGGPLAREVVSSLTLTRGASGTYTYSPAGGGFFPLDGQGWVEALVEREDCTPAHNFGFTSEVRYWFVFEGGEQLTFSGDDDVWVFVGGQLALDLGGIHGELTGTITLNADGTASCTGSCVQPSRNLGLEVGRIYEVALFHAERRGCGSNFRLDLNGFDRIQSSCQEVCGDGILTRGEQCDDGNEVDDDECGNDCEFTGPI